MFISEKVDREVQDQISSEIPTAYQKITWKDLNDMITRHIAVNFIDVNKNRQGKGSNYTLLLL
jgi:hypothetical protein